MRDWIYAEDENLWDRDNLVRSAKSRNTLKGFCSTLSDCDENENLIRVERCEPCVRPEQRFYAGYRSGGGKKMTSTTVLVRSESDDKEEVWVSKVLVQF